jgi:hypothetical protein
MTFTALIAVCALFGVLFFIAAIRRLRRRRVLGGMAHGGAALIFFLAAACAVLIGTNLRSYQRLSYEQPAGELQFTKQGDRTFEAHLNYPDGERASFPLRGDEWQVDARVLKWHAFANLVGFDAAYRLERISGRYTRIEDERSQPFARSRPRRSLGIGAPLPLVDSLDGCTLWQRHLPADGGRSALRDQSLPERPDCETPQSSCPRLGRQLALINRVPKRHISGPRRV